LLPLGIYVNKLALTWTFLYRFFKKDFQDSIKIVAYKITSYIFEGMIIVLVKKYCLEGWTLFADECYKMGDTEETWASANTW